MTEYWDGQFTLLLRQVLPYLTADMDIAPDLDLSSYGLDSFGIVELIFLIEEEYGISPEQIIDLPVFTTPKLLWEAIEDARRTDRNGHRQVGST